MATNQSLGPLADIKHIVVLMMENRSFDQMLGYLARAGIPEVEGLTGTEFNRDKDGIDGKDYGVFEWGEEDTVFHPPEDPTGKIFDPCHSPECIAEQLKEGNKGFVRNFVETRKTTQGQHFEIPEQWRGLPMGYYTGGHLPVYDHLARNFCVCDHWHASVPGDTWPNRLYSLSGQDGERVGHKPSFAQLLLARFRKLPLVGAIADAPLFEVEAFTRHLADDQWRWYSHDPATLRAADKEYRRLFNLKPANFTFFNRKRLRWETQALESPIVGHDSFLDDAAKGELRDVSWIDPNFIDLKILDPNSNDDHPPSDVRAGQTMVLELYEALVNSPNWEETMLVIVYDEHGGFHDHVPPPPASDGPYSTLGVRVPALVVGPKVRKFVCHDPFEHTTLIATILRRFAADPEQALGQMPERVRKSPHLGAVLQDQMRRDIQDHGHLDAKLEGWRHEARSQRRPKNGRPSRLPDGAGHDLALHEFQDEFARFAFAMRDHGLPPGQP